MPESTARPRDFQAAKGTLGISVDRSAAAPPLFRQIQDGIRHGMLTGAIGVGMRLPAERELAAILGVNRTTIMHAYQELAAEGLVTARPGRGTVISLPDQDQDLNSLQAGTDSSWLLTMPSFGNGTIGPDPNLLRDIADLSAQPNLINFAAGAPGVDLMPVAALQRELASALSDYGGGILGYGPVEGLPALRESIALRMQARGARVSSSEVIVVSGATQGLALAARALIEPGDEVAVEAPSYVGVLQTFAAAGARLIGVPMDRHGLRVDELATILSRRRIRLIVVQPTLQNPTNSTLSLERRERLLSLAERYGVPILEDDAYGELWHDGSGPAPLKAIDRHGNVIYLGTFSKTIAPALRLGWCVAPHAVIGRLALAKQFADLQSGVLAQLAVNGFMVSGAYTRHLEACRQAYNERRTTMLAELSTLPMIRAESSRDGGLYVWCRLPEHLPARTLAAAAGRAGVAILAGDAFYPQGSLGQLDGSRFMRLSFSSQT
ncbi:MAG: PLP-dependent aminotransferase family protein, partial [Chloroflexi bacterium]|nr:PLP-dependent aminotransferase family protein [Chloroflexota bacterium]